MGFDDQEPMGVEVQGKTLECLICGHDAFRRREALFGVNR